MCRLLQVGLFLTVRHAVKHGVIGMLRTVVDPLILVFDAGQHNYGREMLYHRWLLSDVNKPELQDAIITAGLVNWPGRASAHKPIDLSLEHHLCLEQFRLGVLACVEQEIVDHRQEDAMLGTHPFCHAWFSEILANGVHLVSGNRSDAPQCRR